MNVQMARLLLTLMVGFSAAVPLASAQDEVRNGGDFLAMQFDRVARETLWVLTNLAPADKILTDAQIALYRDAQTLKIVAVEGPLYDNEGDRVDAKVDFDPHGEPRRIMLNEATWSSRLSQEDDGHLHQMVFHELLRIVFRHDAEAYALENSYTISSRLLSDPAWSLLNNFLLYPSRPGHGGGNVPGSSEVLQNCELATAQGPFTSFAITYLVKDSHLIDIESIKVNWSEAMEMDRITEVWPRRTITPADPDIGSMAAKIDGFSFRGISESTSIEISSEWMTTSLTLMSDDNGVGAFVKLSSDGPVLLSYYRCQNYPF